MKMKYIAIASTLLLSAVSAFGQNKFQNFDRSKVIQMNTTNSTIQKVNSSPTNISIVSKEEMYPNLNDGQKSNLEQFDVTPGGLFYRYIERGPNFRVSRPGDIASIHVEYKLGDSLIFSTTNLNAEGEPVVEVLKGPQYRGDVNEGLLMMKPGDKMEFKYFVDSLSRHANMHLPPYVKSGDFATWTITMYSLKTMEEHKKDMENHKNEQAKIDDKLINEYLTKNKLNATKTPSGVYIIFHEEGFDETPKKGQKVTVNYTGKLLDSTVFDSNTDPAFNHVQPFTFTLQAGQVIKGWDEGVSLMRRKSKATIIIPSTLAYGEKSPGPQIPANSILIFDIELLDYK